MKKINELNGMFWEKDDSKWEIPKTDTLSATKIYMKNIHIITWHVLSSIERNRTSLPQTETILKGQSVSGISIDELIQVKNYGDASKTLIKMLRDGTFKMDTETALKIHNFVGKDEALEWGVLRKSQVNIGGVEYTPPPSDKLQDIMDVGLNYIENKIEKPDDKAVLAFLFISRTQPFYDANKRTASLMMNGSLMKDGIYPITVLNRDSEEFHTKLTKFYNTGDATQMISFMKNTVKTLYQDKVQYQSKEKDCGRDGI